MTLNHPDPDPHPSEQLRRESLRRTINFNDNPKCDKNNIVARNLTPNLAIIVEYYIIFVYTTCSTNLSRKSLDPEV